MIYYSFEINLGLIKNPVGMLSVSCTSESVAKIVQQFIYFKYFNMDRF